MRDGSKERERLWAAPLVLMVIVLCGSTTSARGGAGPSSHASSGRDRFIAALSLRGVPLPTDPVDLRLLAEYGALFVCPHPAVVLPPTVRFRSAVALDSFQASVPPASISLHGTEIQLQAPALAALQEAIAALKRRGLDLTPRGDSSAATRAWAAAARFWTQRVENGIAHWIRMGKLEEAQGRRVRALAPADQVGPILALESSGLWFSTGLDKSILRSVAVPGASQHHFMLALDITEHDSAEVRSILADKGWFQTVLSDLPHFTYLGATTDQLRSLGLVPREQGGRTFWIPDL